jgi:hypothetical protein
MSKVPNKAFLRHPLETGHVEVVECSQAMPCKSVLDALETSRSTSLGVAAAFCTSAVETVVEVIQKAGCRRLLIKKQCSKAVLASKKHCLKISEP